MVMKTFASFFLFTLLFITPLLAQDEGSIVSETNYDALALRGIGPAFTSGRIADLAINPENENIW